MSSTRSARSWSVSKLRALRFEGDADALAAYVDALVENNRDEEAGDPALLREQATADLADFLGQHDADDFVNGLMAFLKDGDRTETPADTRPAPEKPPDRPPAPESDGPQPRPERKTQLVVQPQHQPKQHPPHQPPQRNTQQHHPPRNRSRSPPARGARPSSNGLHVTSPTSRPARFGAKLSVIDRLGSRKPGPNNMSAARGKRARDADDADNDRHSRRRRPNHEPRYPDARRTIEEHRAASPPRRGARRMEQKQGAPDRRFWQEDVPGAGRDLRRGRGERGMNDLSGQSWEKKPDGEKAQGALPPPFGFPPMMTPEMMMKFPPPFPPGMMPPPPPGMMPPPMPGVGRGGFRGDRGRDGRGRDGRDGRDIRDNRGNRNDRDGRNDRDNRDGRDNRGRGARGTGTPDSHGGQSGRKQYFVLAMRNVPEDKLKLPHILKFFETYGTPDNVQLVTPDRAFIIYATREPALAAVKSVDAVMGNRHIRLGWATAVDYDVAGLELTDEGVLKPSANRRKGNRDERRTEKGERRGERMDTDRGDATPKKDVMEAVASETIAQREIEKQEATKAAEEDLRKKRAAIAEARAKQEEEKASLQARKKQLVEEQKALFAEMEKTADHAAKLELFRQAKTIESQLKQVVSELNPASAAAVQQAQPQGATTPAQARRGGMTGRGRGRGRGGRFEGFSVDNRPKTLQIMGANPGIAIETAMSIFHETLSAEKVGAFWLLNFPTRRAAESALRARGPLKRGFGPAAMSQIVAGPQSTMPQRKGAESDASTSPAAAEKVVGSEPAEKVAGDAPAAPEPAQEEATAQPMAMSLDSSAMMIDTTEGGPPAASGPFPTQPIAE